MATCVRVACQPAAGVPVAPKGKPLIHTNKQRVKGKGILTPLLITFDDRVISGHRRLAAARAAGLSEVPISPFGSRDELDIKEALIHTNKQREKTMEVKAREWEFLKEVYRERESRQGKGGGKPAHFPQLDKSTDTSEKPLYEVQQAKPSVRAAEAIGHSQPTLSKALTVVKTIDALSDAGCTDAADALRAKLNKSVDRAYKQVKAADVIVPVQEPEEERAVVVDRAAAMLAQCRTPVEAKRVADLAKAAEVYARLQKSGEEAVAHARAICVDALTLMGELLKAAQKATGGQPYQAKPTGSRREPVAEPPPTLAEQGISKKQSSTAQALATVKEKAPEVYAEIKGGKLGVAAAHVEVKRLRVHDVELEEDATEEGDTEDNGKTRDKVASAGNPAKKRKRPTGSLPVGRMRWRCALAYFINGEFAIFSPASWIAYQLKAMMQIAKPEMMNISPNRQPEPSLATGVLAEGCGSGRELNSMQT